MVTGSPLSRYSRRVKMKKPFNPIPLDYTPKAKRKVEEVNLDLKPCLNCGKPITDGYYGRYGGGGVCSKTCNTSQEAKPKYPEHSEEDFLNRLKGKK